MNEMYLCTTLGKEQKRGQGFRRESMSSAWDYHKRSHLTLGNLVAIKVYTSFIQSIFILYSHWLYFYITVYDSLSFPYLSSCVFLSLFLSFHLCLFLSLSLSFYPCLCLSTYIWLFLFVCSLQSFTSETSESSFPRRKKKNIIEQERSLECFSCNTNFLLPRRRSKK